MTPLVYFQIGDLESFLRKKFKGNEIIRGFAYAYDSNSVFHVFSNDIEPHIKANLINAYFENISYDIYKKYLNKNSEFPTKKIEDPHLVISIAKGDNDQILAIAHFYNDKEFFVCEARYIPNTSDLYSRSKGLLETDILRNKTVSIIGLGSGGSFIAIELAKAGVGNFILFDFDRLELSNISRHICGINDLGRFKTLGVRDLIWQKNPSAQVKTHEININEDLNRFNSLVQSTDVIICATDTNSSRFNVNQTSINQKIVSLFGRAITRAAGGDVLRVRPFEGPCLNCLFSTGLVSNEEEISQMRQMKSEMPAYVSDDQAANMIQVGLSSDIIPIAIMVIKLALVELAKGSESGISSLEQDLVADFYLWANRRERIYSNWPKLEYNFTKQTILRWYGAKVVRNEECIVCGEKNVIDDNFFSNPI